MFAQVDRTGHEVITIDWAYIVEHVLKVSAFNLVLKKQEREQEVIEKCQDIMKSCLNSLELTEDDKRGYAMFAVCPTVSPNLIFSSISCWTRTSKFG